MIQTAVLTQHHRKLQPPIDTCSYSQKYSNSADGIDSGLDFEKALDDPSMPKMSSPTQVSPFLHLASVLRGPARR